MANYCQGCTKTAQREYWNRGTNHRFFKFMISDFHHHLRIPKTFVDRFNGDLQGWFSLQGPSGSKWVVHLNKTSDDTYFSDGWDKFSTDNGLKVGDLVLFCYGGDSEFKVNIFSSSTSCEVETCYFVKNTLAAAASSSSSPSPSARNCACILHGYMCYGSSDSDNENKSEDNNNNNNCDGDYEEECNEMHGNNDGNGEYYESDGDNDYEEEEEEHLWFDRKGKRARNVSKKPRTSTIKHRHICLKSNRRKVSREEKKKAKELSLEYMVHNGCDGVPMFQITLLPTHVYTSFQMTIPKKWAINHMHNKAHEVELLVQGVKGRWLVGCWWSPLGQCKFITRWAEFVKDNKLESDDCCVFQLIRPWSADKSCYPRFNVHIFRVVSKPVAPTPVRRYW